MEEPLIEGAGSKVLGEEAASALQDANGMCRIGGVDAGTSESVGVGTGLEAADRFSLMAGFALGATIYCFVAPSRG
jgi:hypothetical protein